MEQIYEKNTCIIKDRYIKEDKSRNIFVGVLVFLVIFISQDTLLFGTNKNTLMIDYGQYAIIGFCFFYAFILFLKYNNKFRFNKFLFLSSILTLLILTLLITNEQVTNYIYKAALIFCGYLFTELINRKTFVKLYVNILALIAFMSIIMYLIYILFPDLLLKFPSVINIKGIKFDFAIFSAAPIKAYSPYARSYGIFREPAVFSCFLLLSLYFVLFENKTPSLFKVLILSVALLLTFSTTGYIVLFGLFFAYFLRKENRNIKNNFKSKLFFVFIVALVFMLVFLDLLSKDGIIFGKFNKASGFYESTLSRLNSFWVNLQIAWKNPILGMGAYQTDALFFKYTGIIDNTNTFLSNFANYGFIYGGLICFAWYKFFRKKNGVFLSILLFLIFFAQLSGSSLVLNSTFYIIAFYGISGKERANEK